MFVYLIATKLLLDEEITYTKHLAPLFARQCAPCHQANGSAPFDFSTYSGVKANLSLIRQQLQSRAMPPVRTTSDYVPHRFRAWTDEELVWFQVWDRAGAPPDNGVQARVSIDPPFAFSHNSKVGNGNKVEAEGAPYWEVLSCGSLPQNLSAFTIRPESPRSVKSVVLVAVPKGTKVSANTKTNVPPASALVVGVWSPLYPVFSLPASASFTLPAGYEYMLWALYQPQGKEVSGGMMVMVHAPDKKGHAARAVRAEHPAFTVKERESKWLTVSHKVDKPSMLYTATPLARFYCNVIKLFVQQPGDSEELIATINKHDPYWTQTLPFETPIKLQAGAKVVAKYFYANDKYCRMNEGKEPEIVRSGQKITDEACELRLLLGE